ncbi:MAG: hypothetical protein ACLGIZ_18730, partial [Acidimicrobiia bacterium]
MNDDHAPGDELVGRIADAYDDLPPIPERLTEAARGAFAWRRADAQLAELLADSADAELVGVRGSASTDRRAFRYGAGDFVIRLHLTEATLIVMVEPPLSVGCRVVTEAATTEHRTDELGELVTDAPELPIRIEVDLPAGS